MSSFDSVLLLWVHGKGVAHMKMTDCGMRGSGVGAEEGMAVDSPCHHTFRSKTKPRMHPFLKGIKDIR